MTSFLIPFSWLNVVLKSNIKKLITAWLSGIKKCSARVLVENGTKNVPGLQNSLSWIIDLYT
jgi:hypothetical protein